MSRPRFRYEDPVLAAYPTVVGGVLSASGVRNGPSPALLARAFGDEQEAVLAQIGGRPLPELEPLSAWRRVFRGFGVDPTQYRCAAEALLRRLTKQGGVPSISLLVDIGNLVSIRYRMPVAVFDQRAVTGGTVVRFASGTERFTDLGTEEVVSPEPGEVVFVDDAGLVSARRWCWRQSAESAAGPATTDVLVTVEGHHAAASVDVAAAVDDLRDLLSEHACPATLLSDILHLGAPSFD